jgi:hypothetical protein
MAKTGGAADRSAVMIVATAIKVAAMTTPTMSAAVTAATMSTAAVTAAMSTPMTAAAMTAAMPRRIGDGWERDRTCRQGQCGDADDKHVLN